VLDLPAPAAAVIHIDQPDGGFRTIVLADPRVPAEQIERAVAAADLLEREGVRPPRIEIPRQRHTTLRALAGGVRRAAARLPGTSAVILLALFANRSMTACTVPPIL
jgi:hypothetical protein